MRVLVGSMGSTAAQNLVHALRADEEAWWVLGGDLRTRHGGLGLANDDVRLPAGADANAYVSRVKELVAERQLDAFVPVMEPELRVATTHREQLESTGVKVLVSEPKCIETCASKRALAAAFSRVGLDTPASRTKSGPYPIFVRPDAGSGSRNARIVESTADITRMGNEDFVLTEVLEGKEFSIDGFARPGGGIEQCIARTRDEVRSGLAVRSCVVELPDDLREKLVELCTSLGIEGFFNVQYRDVPTRGPVFFDLNPRLGGAMSLSFAAGLCAPDLLRAWMGRGPWPGPAKTRVGTELHRRWHNVIFDAP